MANPIKENCLLADSLSRPLITERQANIADPASITQVAAPVGGTGATAGAYDTAGNRNLAITSINAARADIAVLRAKQIEILDLLEAHGLMVES